MTTLSYDLESYRDYLRFSNQRHLLVEGRDDKRVFALFLDHLRLKRGSKASSEDVNIDTAQDLIGSSSGMGNREKVESVCASVSPLPYAGRLVGFADREFREFDRRPCVADRIGGHRVQDRLVWSRGHSIENYYFEFSILRSPLRMLSVTTTFSDALALFELLLEQTIRLACAASLAGDELQILKAVKSSVSPPVLILHSGEQPSVELDLTAWRNRLMKQQRLSASMADAVTKEFQSWSNGLQSADFSVARWMCHGHIGLAFIWAVYSRCILDVCMKKGHALSEAKAEAQRVLKAEESVRFSVCADLWVQRALGGHCAYPEKVFELLGLSAPAT